MYGTTAGGAPEAGKSQVIQPFADIFYLSSFDIWVHHDVCENTDVRESWESTIIYYASHSTH